MAAAANLGIPASNSTVQVSIIDHGARLRLPMSVFVQPEIEGHTHLDCPAYSFLIEHPQHGKTLFDLGLRKDVENLAPRILEVVKANGWLQEAQNDVVDVLEQNGTKASEIKSVIWSHWHYDHVGDMSRFPASTELVVGAGFVEVFTPAYPTNTDSLLLESDYKGREVREIDFSTHTGRLRLGPFDAVDFFGDGSFYLLSTPGHALGHMCGLARTTPNSFILTGGDAAHHCGEFRPSPYQPLPDQLSPSPFSDPPFRPGTVCPGALVEERAHPRRSRTAPFYQLKQLQMRDFDLATAQRTVEKLSEFDGDENVLVVIAHDTSLKDVVEFFPKMANAWKEKGWKGVGLWRFLADFLGAVKD